MPELLDQLNRPDAGNIKTLEINVHIWKSRTQFLFRSRTKQKEDLEHPIFHQITDNSVVVLIYAQCIFITV